MRAGYVALAIWCCLGPPSWTSGSEIGSDLDVDEVAAGELANCLVETVTSGTFDDYHQLADVGNEPSERYSVNLSFTVELGNRQEELAVLLSAQDRTRAHPAYAHTYEMRLTNVYTVLYRETVKLQAYHSPRDKLFPAELRFRLRFLVSHDANVTVLVNDERAPRPLLAVSDVREPFVPRFVSFSSRMNAYPVSFYLGCGLPRYTASTEPPDVDPADDGEPRMEALLLETAGRQAAAAAACPVCPPQRCEVIVKACADPTSGNGNGGLTGSDPEREKYYFFFNLYLTKNRGKGR
ncbi:uncharacterized protein LOC128269212 [Anopheles cruzii]|uniref:uncharacterized protein LOC128269212 n=1 Tax=Anopheles cruzii TaxID=68878 RepID=UPI0022EC84D8|nr:uncharacterized protein LOC128269212 [Anopheles cruzii]